MAHSRRQESVHLVTQARRSMSDDIAYRQRRYLLMMGIRAVCFVIAVVLFTNHFGWLAAIPAAGAIFIPYFAVVFANGGREPDNTRGFMEYHPNVPATRDPAGPPEANGGNAGQPAQPRSSENLSAPRLALLSAVPRSGCNWVLTHLGAFPCNIHIGALVPRRSTTAGVPGPRRNADERDAGWFAPVATRRRPMLAALWAASAGLAALSRGDDPPDPPRGSLFVRGLFVGLVPWAGGSSWAGAEGLSLGWF